MWTILVSRKAIICVTPKGERVSLAWDDLRLFEVHTIGSSPWGANVCWVLVGAKIRLAIPQGAAGEKKLLDRIQALPGFDHETFISAMISTGNKVFRCWSKDPPTR